ncbi:MAG: XRE family transcriptional regulator [Enterococcus aquimarinus]|uniref:XRE family transcriptional regulator n=1 Tax=Enterococcus aquimarinus TaxID=328396 RepID=A0A9E3ZUN6_9ENTE|nr:XRE family transcriptional regulator [Enterococcus aquimarinus]
METLGSRLRKLREQRNMTQTELSQTLGMKTYTTVSKWESDDNFPKGKDLKVLAELFNVSSDYLLGLEKEITNKMSIESIYNQLDQPRKTKVYNFAEYQLREQNKKTRINIVIRGYVSAGTGEWLEETIEEVSYEGEIPEHDFAVKVNGESMLPLFADGEIIFVKATSEARDGQIIICQVNSEAYVKKLSGNKLVSLNKQYEDILISETDDFKIFGIVVL